MKLILKVVVLTAICLALLKATSPYLGMNNRLVGQPAPDFTLELVSGQKASMTQLRNSSPAILFFWATWCPHCRTQLKNMTESREIFEKEGIKILLVDVGEERQKVEQYLSVNGVTFDCFLDQSDELSREYDLVGVPTFFFINRDGIIVAAENVLPKNYNGILLSSIGS